MVINYISSNIWALALTLIALVLFVINAGLRVQKIYQKEVKRYIEMEGMQQNDSEKRKLSRKLKIRLVISLIVVVFLIWLFWSLALPESRPKTGEFILGIFFCNFGLMYFRAVHNGAIFKCALRPGSLNGKLVQSKWLIASVYGSDYAVFALFSFVLYIFFGRLFFLGAFFGALGGVLSQRKSAKKLQKSAP